MKVMDLKRELKAMGLSTVGSKSELVDRFRAATATPDGFLTGTELGESSLGSTVKVSADTLLAPPVGEAGNGSLSYRDEDFLSIPSRAPSSAGSQGRPFQEPPEDTTTEHASQHFIEPVTDEHLQTIRGLSQVSCKDCDSVAELRRMHKQEMEELEVRIGGFAERLQQAATEGNILREMQRKFTLMEQQLKELLEWRELLQGREARSLKSMPSTTLPATLSMSKEQSNDALVGFDISNLSDRRNSAGRTQCEDLTQYVSDFMQHGEELETDLNKIPSVKGPNSEGVIGIDEPKDDSTEDLNLLHISNDPDDSKRPGIPDGATTGLRLTSFIKRQEVSKGLTRLDRPPPGVTREVLIVGDSNVERIAQPFVSAVNNPQSVEVMFNRKATAEQVHTMIDEYEEGARKIPRMYIIHVGINDLLKGYQPENVVEVFRKRWSSRKASLTICSVPEVVSKGKAVQAATMMLNAKIKGLCRKIRARYVDLTAELTGHNTMDKDGVHYGEMGACVVSQQLAQVARRFLEGNVQRGVGGTASQSWKAPENLERRYQWNREEQRTKPPFGFNDAHQKSHRTPAFRLLKPSRHSCRPDSRAHPYTKRPQQSFPQVRPYGNTVTDDPFPHPRDAEVRQQLPYPAVVNYTPTPGLEQQVRYVDSNIRLPPATGVPEIAPRPLLSWDLRIIVVIGSGDWVPATINGTAPPPCDTRRRLSQLSYFHKPGNRPLLPWTLADVLDKTADAKGDNKAIVSCHQGITKTYTEYRNDMNQFAASLMSLNLPVGSRIGIMASNLYEWGVVQFATAKAGLVLVNINPAYQAPELEHCLNHSSATADQAPAHGSVAQPPPRRNDKTNIRRSRIRRSRQTIPRPYPQPPTFRRFSVTRGLSQLSYFHKPGKQPLLPWTLADVLDKTADAKGDTKAIVSCHQGITKTYTEYRNDDRHHGVEPLRRGVVQFATAKAGLVLVNINPAYQAPELEHCLNHTECEAVILSEKFAREDYHQTLLEIAPELGRFSPGELKGPR
ncbi:hypothetical protein ISCGN_011453 [Ixodes scapularis]